MKTYRGFVVGLICLLVGYALGCLVREPRAAAQQAAERVAPRFRVAAFAAPSGGGSVLHGCYVIDSTTGEVWHVRSGGAPEKVAQRLE